MTVLTPNNIISQATVSGPDNRWLAFFYNGKPRIALELGRDERNTDNLFCITPDGYRCFNEDSMVSVRDVTTVVA